MNLFVKGTLDENGRSVKPFYYERTDEGLVILSPTGEQLDMSTEADKLSFGIMLAKTLGDNPTLEQIEEYESIMEQIGFPVSMDRTREAIKKGRSSWEDDSIEDWEDEDPF